MLQKANKFSQNQGQYKRIQISRILMLNLQSQVAELVRRLRTMWKILCFSGGQSIFPNITDGKVSLRAGQKSYSFIGWGDIIWIRGSNFNKFINRLSHRGASYWGTGTVCLNLAKAISTYGESKFLGISSADIYSEIATLYNMKNRNLKKHPKSSSEECCLKRYAVLSQLIA